MIALDQADVGHVNGSGTTAIFTTNNVVAAGATIFLAVSCFNVNTTISSVTDNGPGLTYSVDSEYHDASVSSKMIVSAYAPTGMAAGTQITVTMSGSVNPVVLASSFTGVKTPSPLDAAGTGGHKSTASTSWATNAVTLQAGSLLFGHAETWATDTTPSVTTGTELQRINGGAGSFEMVSGYLIAGAGGSYNLAGTWGGSFADDQISAGYLAAPSQRNAMQPRRMPLGV